MAEVAIITRRDVFKSVLAAALVTALPKEVPYTVESYISDLTAAGADLAPLDDGLFIGTANLDWSRFTTARIRAKSAGIEHNDVYNRLRFGAA